MLRMKVVKQRLEAGRRSPAMVLGNLGTKLLERVNNDLVERVAQQEALETCVIIRRDSAADPSTKKLSVSYWRLGNWRL